MKTPQAPPNLSAILDALGSDPRRLIDLVSRGLDRETSEKYAPWDRIRFKTPPEGWTSEEWWASIKVARNTMRRTVPLVDKHGRPFTYSLPDAVLRAVDDVNRDASGMIAISEQVTDKATRDRYLVNSLIEESITSSQLEGASTSRPVAKEMIRSGRSPRDRSERMIWNNFQAMQRIIELQEEPLSVGRVLEIHRIVTEGTLDDPTAAGRFQAPDDERIAVFSDHETVVHTPPDAVELPERVARLSDFANGADTGSYLPPVLRAITVHFMIGYDHPFEDGNGRTARALFYWTMLRHGFWLTEFLAISRILKAAPSQYIKSYIHTEQDDNDLTYFHLYQLQVLRRSIGELHHYLAERMRDQRDFQVSLAPLAGQLNRRQLAVLEHAVKNAAATYTAQSHAGSHSVTIETARQDLRGLDARGLLHRERSGKANVWHPVPDLTAKLHT